MAEKLREYFPYVFGELLAIVVLNANLKHALTKILMFPRLFRDGVEPIEVFTRDVILKVFRMLVSHTPLFVARWGSLTFLCPLDESNTNFYNLNRIVTTNKLLQCFKLFECAVCKRNCESSFLRTTLNHLFFFSCDGHTRLFV